MIIRKNNFALSLMREAGKRLAHVFEKIPSFVKPGVTTKNVDALIEETLKSASLHSQCKGYGSPAFPCVSCISLNDVVVHGVPSHIILKEGDVITVDICASYNGYCADMARTFFVGQAPSDEAVQLVEVAYQALDAGISMARAGCRISDISSAVQRVVEPHGFGIIRDFAGHGIGKKMHEDPQILNYGVPGKGPLIEAGMAFALEPMITLGDHAVIIDADKWTARTVDGSLSAHVEDTVIVTDRGPEITTRL